MQKENPDFAHNPGNLPRDDDPEYLVRARDTKGKLRCPLATSISAFPTHIEGDDLRPVRICTLGVFSLNRYGKPVGFDSNSAGQALEFLKTLIALGGREVSLVNLTAALWPEADGQAAQRSVEAALCSLHETLGEERILVSRNGSISLDPHDCWVDAWDFETTLAEIRRLLNEDISGEHAARFELLSARLLELYQGDFLTGEDTTPWFVSLRERLRIRFIEHLLDAGRYWEFRGLWDKAIACYQRGLEVDDLVEDFYRHLMVCCLETQRICEGLAVYRQCRKVLSTVLDLQPAPETEALHHTLMAAVQGTHTA